MVVKSRYLSIRVYKINRLASPGPRRGQSRGGMTITGVVREGRGCRPIEGPRKCLEKGIEPVHTYACIGRTKRVPDRLLSCLVKILANTPEKSNRQG